MPIPPSNSPTLDSPAKPTTAKTADDINDLFNELDNEPEVKEPVKPPKEKEEPKEEDEDELELVEPDDEDEEKLDLTKEETELEVEAPPRKKEILKKYPDVFKDFPFLEKMLYRDKQYSELFGSFDDAKEIAEKSEIFNAFESQLLQGDTKEILKTVKETDERAYNILVDDYLPNLAAVDKEAYFHVVGNLNRRLIMEMVEEANKIGKDNEEQADSLRQAALIINQFVFGSSQFTAPKARVDRSQDPKKNEVEQERLNFVKEQYETHRDEMQTRVDNKLRATISEYIDPRGVMSGYVKKNAVSDAMKYLNDAIGNDESVVKNLEKLWRAAFDNKFNRANLGRIESFYLGKAKGALKNAILKARSEALKDQRPSSRTRETDEEEEETPRRRPTGRPSQPNKRDNNGPRKGESVTDFFMRD